MSAAYGLFQRAAHRTLLPYKAISVRLSMEMHCKLMSILVASGNRTPFYGQQTVLGCSVVGVQLCHFGPYFLCVGTAIDLEICSEIHENVCKVRYFIIEQPSDVQNASLPKSARIPNWTRSILPQCVARLFDGHHVGISKSLL